MVREDGYHIESFDTDVNLWNEISSLRYTRKKRPTY